MMINGTVASGFESVRALYEKNMHALVERNTQLCVYVDGQCVVDLWASAIGDEDFGPDSLINVFSSGKSLEAITMAMLADKGLIDYDAKISDYWPEYAQNGKDQTIADLMRHEAGLAALDTTIDPNDLHPDRARNMARQIRTGNVHLNGAGLNQQAPFGGYKQSGNGREWGQYGFEEFLEVKAILGYS